MEQPARLVEAAAALSVAADLGLGLPSDAGLRSTLLALRFAATLGVNESERQRVCYVALLRFAGCTAHADLAERMHGGDPAAGEWLELVDFGKPGQIVSATIRSLPPRRAMAAVVAGARFARAVGRAHCEVAGLLARRLRVPAPTVHAIELGLERWDGRGLPGRVRGEELPLALRIVQVAQDAEPFARRLGVDAAAEMARQRAGGEFDPELAEAFASHAGELLHELDDAPVWESLLDAEPGPRPLLDDAGLDDACAALGEFADQLIAHTLGHSPGVAALAEAAAQQLKLPTGDVAATRRAALLHDLGRAGVPPSVWQRPGPLDAEDWERVRLHPYVTERVLARAAVLGPLGRLGSLHHERLDGSGYHRGVRAAELPLTARVIAAADAYHAMREPRPHRSALTAATASRELEQTPGLDADAVAAVLAASGQRRPAADNRGLSAREIEVLRLAARGLSVRAVASSLQLAPKTVDTHLQRIYTKLEVSTRPAAALAAVRRGLLEPD